MSVQSLIKSAYLFKEFGDSEIESVSQITTESTFGPGEEVFSQGDPARAMFMIKMGSVKIEQKGRTGSEMVVTTLGSGSLLGEMAYVDQEKRSATATVIEKTTVLTIPYEKLSALLKADNKMALKFYETLCKFLCSRLRVTTTDLSFAKEKNFKHF